MPDSLVMKSLPWDSKQLGIPCGLVACPHCSNDAARNTAQKIDHWLEKNKALRFVTFKIPAHCTALVNYYLHRGAQLVDTELVFRYMKSSLPLKASSSLFSFSFADAVDSEPFQRLADEMLFSRFYQDPCIGYEKANRLWRQSIKNHCEGRADKLLVAYKGTKPCGLIVLHQKGNKDFYLYAVGVLKKYQGKNVGSMMLQKVIEKYGRRFSLFVETQAANIPALKLYQKNGFVLDRLTCILHLWRT